MFDRNQLIREWTMQGSADTWNPVLAAVVDRPGLSIGDTQNPRVQMHVHFLDSIGRQGAVLRKAAGLSH
jgi:hypothetical protein